MSKRGPNSSPGPSRPAAKTRSLGSSQPNDNDHVLDQEMVLGENALLQESDPGL